MIFPFSFFKSDSKEILQAVRFDNDLSNYFQSDDTGTQIVNNDWSSRTFELYIRRNNVSSTNFVYHVSNLPTSAGVYLVCHFNGNNIRFGYFRSGPYYYRRDYPFPTDGEFHHVVFSHRNSGGSTREACYIDGVEASVVSSAYVSSTTIVPSTQFLTLGKRANNTFPLDADLCYWAMYYDNYIPPSSAGTAALYYDSRLDLDARRDSKPSGDIPKPVMFFCANDIVDIASDWTDSNLGIQCNTYGTLNLIDV